MGEGPRIEAIESTGWSRGVPSGMAMGGHVADPRTLLELTRWAYGRSPEPSWLVTIPACDLRLGAPLSTTTERALGKALRLIRGLIAR